MEGGGVRLLEIPKYEVWLMMKDNPNTVIKYRELIHQEKTTRIKSVKGSESR